MRDSGHCELWVRRVEENGQRMDEDRLPKIVTRNRPDGRRGRPKKKMVTKLKDGRILPGKNNRLLSLEIRRRRRSLIDNYCI